MEDIQIDYQSLMVEKLYLVIKDTLSIVETLQYLPGEHHFYFDVISKYKNVILPKFLLDKFPDTITLVIQHEFENLIVTDDGFSVVLFFNGMPENINIPFEAITRFYDPSAPFALEFKKNTKEEIIEENNSDNKVTKFGKKKSNVTTQAMADDKDKSEEDEKSNIVTFKPKK